MGISIEQYASIVPVLEHTIVYYLTNCTKIDIPSVDCCLHILLNLIPAVTYVITCQPTFVKGT